MIELNQVNTKQLCIEREIKRNKMAMNGHVPRKGMRIWPKLHQNGNQDCKRNREKKTYGGMSRRMGKYKIKEIGKT
jgi:hypothetical protein